MKLEACLTLLPFPSFLISIQGLIRENMLPNDSFSKDQFVSISVDSKESLQ